MNDFDQISTEASDRLSAELHRSIAAVGAAADDAAQAELEAAEAHARTQAALAAARVEHLADDGLEPLRRLSAELLQRARELDREIDRLARLAAAAAAALEARPSAAPPAPAAAPEPPAPPKPAAPELRPEPFELPPILPTLAPESPLDKIEAHRRSIAEAPIEFPPRRRRFRDPAKRPVEIPPGVRVIVEQLRIAGAADAAILTQLEDMGVDDPEAVLAQVESVERTG